MCAWLGIDAWPHCQRDLPSSWAGCRGRQPWSSAQWACSKAKKKRRYWEKSDGLRLSEKKKYQKKRTPTLLQLKIQSSKTFHLWKELKFNYWLHNKLLHLSQRPCVEAETLRTQLECIPNAAFTQDSLKHSRHQRQQSRKYVLRWKGLLHSSKNCPLELEPLCLTGYSWGRSLCFETLLVEKSQGMAFGPRLNGWYWQTLE